LIVFGYAANLDVKHIPTAVRDLDQSVESREVIGRFGSSNYFEIVSFPETPGEVKDLIDRGKAAVSIEIPLRFLEDVEKRKYGRLQVILDGTDSNTTMIALAIQARSFRSIRPRFCWKGSTGQGGSGSRRPGWRWSTAPGSTPIWRAGFFISRR